MAFVKESIRWLKRERGQRSFRIYMAVNAVLAAALTAENMLLFSAGAMKALRYAILLAALAVIAWIDRRSRRIPNRILLALATIRLFLLAVEWAVYPSMGLAVFLSSVGGGLLGGGLFLLCGFLSRGGMGMGDVKLLAVTGLFVGMGVVMTVIFLSVTVSAVYSAVQLLRKKTNLKDEIAFAPFVWIGLLLTMAIGM